MRSHTHTHTHKRLFESIQLMQANMRATGKYSNCHLKVIWITVSLAEKVKNIHTYYTCIYICILT